VAITTFALKEKNSAPNAQRLSTTPWSEHDAAPISTAELAIPAPPNAIDLPCGKKSRKSWPTVDLGRYSATRLWPFSTYTAKEKTSRKAMSTIDEILAHNKTFVEEKGYLKYSTDKYPDKKLAIVSCMDTRLTELLPAALGLKNGDAKIIKNAGGVISHPFGSVIRSLLVAVFELGVKTIMVVGHSNCGAQHMNSDDMICHMLNAGISQDHIDMMHYCGIDFETWLQGFDDGEESVRATVRTIAHHPLIPETITVRGFIIDSTTGKLTPVEE
jgi:carbonic anhydrase